ncbi:MAG: thiamine diphosphokinase [Chloroflexota bacterium]|nr:thiamine diphosphokinase [Chloroflexota bacterium]
MVAAGDLDPADAPLVRSADLLVAADGGTSSLERLGCRPALIVGDLDSSDAGVVDRAAAHGTRMVVASRDKDETDMELALEAALDAGAQGVVLLGALGGLRLDHALANLLLLGDAALTGRNVRVAHGRTRVRAVRAGEPAVLDAQVGDVVSLLPIGGDAEGVVTHGLRYPLRREPLRFGRARGISNVVASAPASIELEAGTLLVFEIAVADGRGLEVGR